MDTTSLSSTFLSLHNCRTKRSLWRTILVGGGKIYDVKNSPSSLPFALLCCACFLFSLLLLFPLVTTITCNSSPQFPRQLLLCFSFFENVMIVDENLVEYKSNH